MGQFANAGRHAEGAAFLDELRRRFDARLDDGQRAIYVSAIASLRAGHANEVPLLKRYGWVRDTVRQLDEAKRLTHDQGFVARWMSGVVRAQLPGFFGERDTALADLTWCLTHVDQAPIPAGCARSTSIWPPCTPGSATRPRRSVISWRAGTRPAPSPCTSPHRSRWTRRRACGFQRAPCARRCRARSTWCRASISPSTTSSSRPTGAS